MRLDQCSRDGVSILTTQETVNLAGAFPSSFPTDPSEQLLVCIPHKTFVWKVRHTSHNSRSRLHAHRIARLTASSSCLIPTSCRSTRAANISMMSYDRPTVTTASSVSLLKRSTLTAVYSMSSLSRSTLRIQRKINSITSPCDPSSSHLRHCFSSCRLFSASSSH